MTKLTPEMSDADVLALFQKMRIADRRAILAKMTPEAREKLVSEVAQTASKMSSNLSEFSPEFQKLIRSALGQGEEERHMLVSEIVKLVLEDVQRVESKRKLRPGFRALGHRQQFLAREDVG